MFEQGHVTIADTGVTSIIVSANWRLVYTPILGENGIQELSYVQYQYSNPTHANYAEWQDNVGCTGVQYRNLLAGWEEKGLDVKEMQSDVEIAAERLYETQVPEELQDLKRQIMRQIVTPGHVDIHPVPGVAFAEYGDKE